MLHLFEHLLGLDSPDGDWYLFWSGFGADIGRFTLLFALTAVYRKHICQHHGCWRLSIHSKYCHHHAGGEDG